MTSTLSHVKLSLVMIELHTYCNVDPKDLLSIDLPLEPADIARSVKFVPERLDYILVPQVIVLPTVHGI